ncbi:MAG: 30S ribosomal protein S16 [Candidatus Kapabacteria bacterium]|nr:30S ribosomal protein S16 [Candidatus Kapabacteria bacterium]MBX7156139.1 30S ribosomal protein S16 [Bacteroidota bacterium]
MVKLRLSRKGRIRAPFYDIVAIDERARRDGAYIERIGTYDPMTSPSTVNIQHDRAVYWLNVGAQPTDTVRLILSFDGVLLRRNLMKKEKSSEEIEAAVSAHRENALKRHARNKYKRKQRKEKAAEAANAPAEGGENTPAAE